MGIETFPATAHGELDNAQNLHNEHRQAEKTPWAQLIFVDVAWGATAQGWHQQKEQHSPDDCTSAERC